MADTSITYNVFAKFHGDSTKMQKFGKAAALVGVAVGALAVKFGKDSVAAAVEAEAAQTKLNDSYAKFKFPADISLASLKAFNSELALKTRFDDDATASGQAVLAQFVDSGKQLQRLTPLLQDYAAKTGQDLPAAAASMGKAFLGNTRALKSLGINYKATGDATTDMANITELMREKVGGFAEKEGKTAAGQAAILKNQFGEVEESVGAKLIPVLLQLATALLGVIAFVQQNSTTMKVAAMVAAAFGVAIIGLVVAVKIQALATALATEGTAAHAVVMKLAAIATGIQTAATWALNAALAVLTSPITLVVVAVAALAAGLIYAYKHSETFRTIVNGAFRAVVDTAQFLWTALKAAFGFIVESWLTVAGAIINGAAKMFGWVPGVGGKLKGAADAFNSFADSVRARLSGAAEIGADFARGIAEGIRAATGLAVGAAGDMSNRIAAQARNVLQEHSPSRVGIEIGQFFPEGVALGIKDKTAVALDAVSAMAAKITEKLKALRQSARDIAQGAAGSVSGMFNFGGIGATTITPGGKDAEGNDLPDVSTTASPVQQFADFAAQSRAFAGAVSQAVAHGLDPRIVAQAVGTGNLTVVQSLAALDPSSARSVNRDFALAEKMAAKVGQTVLSTTGIPADIARQQSTLDTLKEIKRSLASGKIEFHIHDATDPDAVVAAIRRYIKKNGKLRDVAAD